MTSADLILMWAYVRPILSDSAILCSTMLNVIKYVLEICSHQFSKLVLVQCENRERKNPTRRHTGSHRREFPNQSVFVFYSTAHCLFYSTTTTERIYFVSTISSRHIQWKIERLHSQRKHMIELHSCHFTSANGVRMVNSAMFNRRLSITSATREWWNDAIMNKICLRFLEFIDISFHCKMHNNVSCIEYS